MNDAIPKSRYDWLSLVYCCVAGQTLERDSLLRRRCAEDRHGAGLRGPRRQVHQEEGGLREASEGGGARAGDRE